MVLYPNKQKFIMEASQRVISFNDDCERLISRAWEFVQDKQSTSPASKEASFLHPFRVAQRLLAIDIDAETIVAALLYNLFEEKEVSLKEIHTHFGANIARLVEGVARLAPLDSPPEKYWGKSDRREDLSKVFIAIIDDPRIAIIKLADRLYRLTTSGTLTEEQKRKLAKESLEVFAPLAEALGLGVFQSSIQDYAFRYLEPTIYHSLEQRRKEKWENSKKIRETTTIALEDDLEKLGITNYHVYARQKEIYSIYQKMRSYKLSFEEVYDLIGIRVIVDTEEDCFKAARVVDQFGTEVKYDDWISNPRGAGKYQSLHKVIRLFDDTSKELMIEIQIRTREMHRRAERGEAAHWIYKLGGILRNPALIEKMNTLKDTLERKRQGEEESYVAVMALREEENATSIHALSEEHEERHEQKKAKKEGKGNATAPIHIFSPTGEAVLLPARSTGSDYVSCIHIDLKNDFGGIRINGKTANLNHQLHEGDTVEVLKRIRVFSPRRDVISLPEGSTPLDFAYRIHTKLGDEYRGAWVNNKYVAIDYELHDGDVVKIDKRKAASSKLSPIVDVESKAKTPEAQKKIRKYLLSKKRDEMIIAGQNMVRSHLKRLSQYGKIAAQDIVQALIEEKVLHGQVSEEDIYVAIADGKVKYERFLAILGEVAVKHFLKEKEALKEKDAFKEKDGPKEKDAFKEKETPSRESIHSLVAWLANTKKIASDSDVLFFQLVAEGKISSRLLDQAVHELTYSDAGQQLSNMSQSSGKTHSISQELSVHSPHCCYPVRGDEIVGYFTKGKGLALHRATCPQLAALGERQEIRAVCWEDLKIPEEAVFHTVLFVTLHWTDSKIKKKLEDAVSKAGSTLEGKVDINAFRIRLEVSVKDLCQLDKVLERLRKIDSVCEVKRMLDERSKVVAGKAD